MDAIDTTSTDLVTIDANLDVDTPDSFSKELTKTLIVSTATSAAVFGGFIVIATLGPKVVSLFKRNKNDDTIEGEIVTDTTETSSDKK